MDFGDAFKEIKLGKKVTRLAWNNKFMFLFLNNGSTFEANDPPYNIIFPPGVTVTYSSHIDFVTGRGIVVPYNINQLDLMADDWEIVE